MYVRSHPTGAVLIGLLAVQAAPCRSHASNRTSLPGNLAYPIMDIMIAQALRKLEKQQK